MIGTLNTHYVFSSQPAMVANVQGWLDSPASNFGWLLRAADESPNVITARQFGSRESGTADAPALTINFTPPVPVPEPGSLLVLSALAIAAGTRGRPRRRGPARPVSTR